MASVFVIGFGKVGRWLVRALLEEYSGRLVLMGVASSRGIVLPEGPADRAELLRLARSGGKLEAHSSFIPGSAVPDAVVSAAPDIAMIAIPPSYRTGEPNRTIYREILGNGISIVTADKTALALDYEGTIGLALDNGAAIAYRATVMAGTPALDVAHALRYRRVERVRAVLNATTNYVLGLVERGASLEEAVEESIRAGLAEPDPSIDLDGWDAAAKLTILANTLGIKASISDVERLPLSDSPRGPGRLKQVATLDASKGKPLLRVAPERLPPGDPLAGVEGEENIIVFELEGERIILRGPAGPAWRTARVMIGDALEIVEAPPGPVAKPAA